MEKDFAKHIIQQILNSKYSSSARRKIDSFDERLNFNCPYCDDSHIETKKRGNLYLDTLMFICFNCDKKTDLDHIIKDFKVSITPDEKLLIINFFSSRDKKKIDTDIIDTHLTDLIDFNELLKVFNGNDILTDFKPVEGDVYNYILGRGIPSQLHHNIYQAKYWYNGYKYEYVIVSLNRKEDRIIGMQIRNLKDGKARWFKIYNYSKLYEWVYKTKPLHDTKIYDKISYYYNIMNIDFEKTITIFEGYLDSLFFPNSIGVIGVNSDLSYLENSDLKLQYFYDNDAAGHKESAKKIKKGYKVFLWSKLMKDLESHNFKNIKDLNKLAYFFPNPYKKLELKKYFSKDIYDLFYIPK